MPAWALPALTALAAISLTYLCCVRPMLKDRRQAAPAPADNGDTGRLDDQIARARAELDRLSK